MKREQQLLRAPPGLSSSFFPAASFLPKTNPSLFQPPEIDAALIHAGTPPLLQKAPLGRHAQGFLQRARPAGANQECLAEIAPKHGAVTSANVSARLAPSPLPFLLPEPAPRPASEGSSNCRTALRRPPRPADAMASGVQVADEVCRIFYDMKVRKCSTPEEIKKRKKAVIFCLSPDKKCIIVEEGKEILVGDVGVTVTDPFKHFVQMLPEKDCRYALYDASFETKESKKEELMFFLWAPEQAPLKSKMIYASSKDAIKKKFQGIKHECQANGPEDLNRACIAEKLGGSLVVAFEGSPV